jgi:hypothetical protein
MVSADQENKNAQVPVVVRSTATAVTVKNTVGLVASQLSVGATQHHNNLQIQNQSRRRLTDGVGKM